MPRYTRDSYDVLTHNCNTFSNEFVTFLTGTPLPDPIRKLPELIMDTPTDRKFTRNLDYILSKSVLLTIYIVSKSVLLTLYSVKKCLI